MRDVNWHFIKHMPWQHIQSGTIIYQHLSDHTILAFHSDI
jgi:hypothetical protein